MIRLVSIVFSIVIILFFALSFFTSLEMKTRLLVSIGTLLGLIALFFVLLYTIGDN